MIHSLEDTRPETMYPSVMYVNKRPMYFKLDRKTVVKFPNQPTKWKFDSAVL